MGPSLDDGGSYYNTESLGGANDKEWRTPPLWGYRDSGPYLHDGRARSLLAAVAEHGGQAAESARRFRTLAPSDMARVRAFLENVAAPPSAIRAEPTPAEAHPHPDRSPTGRTSVLGTPSHRESHRPAAANPPRAEPPAARHVSALGTVSAARPGLARGRAGPLSSRPELLSTFWAELPAVRLESALDRGS